MPRRKGNRVEKGEILRGIETEMGRVIAVTVENPDLTKELVEVLKIARGSILIVHQSIGGQLGMLMKIDDVLNKVKDDE